MKRENQAKKEAEMKKFKFEAGPVEDLLEDEVLEELEDSEEKEEEVVEEKPPIDSSKCAYNDQFKQELENYRAQKA